MTAIEPMILQWRLRHMMVERGIHTVTELRRRLATFGLEISTQQLNRVVNEVPQRLNTELLAALVTLLHCTPNDLLRFDDATANDARSHPSPSRGGDRSRPAKDAARPERAERQLARNVSDATPPIGSEELLGPKIAPFPLPGQKPRE